jgi:hypothetical protein
MKKLHVSKGEKKKKRMKFTSYWERFYRKKESRSYFPIVQNLMCGLIHTHTSFAFALPSIPGIFPFLTPFTTTFSINHDYLILFFCSGMSKTLSVGVVGSHKIHIFTIKIPTFHVRYRR